MSAGLLVAPCSHAAAKYAVEHWHYSKRIPPPPAVYYGAWENDEFIGVVMFSRGNCRNLLRRYGLDVTEGVELVRVALRRHDAPVSQIVTRAIRLLHVKNSGLRLIVSFADPVQGHRGGIYQAMNWIYAGKSDKKLIFRDSLGKLHDSRVVSHTGEKIFQFGRLTRTVKKENLTRIEVPGKHRYLYPLDKGMRRQISKLARPYPCGRSVEGDAPAALAGDASSTLAGRSINDDRTEASHGQEGSTAETDSAAPTARRPSQPH